MPNTTTPLKARLNDAFGRLWKLHWVMAACFLIIYLIGMVMARLPREVFFRGSLYNVHKSFGVLILGLLLLRIFTLLQVMAKNYLKRSRRFTPQWIKTFSLHLVIYLLMLVVPISGIFLSNTGGHEIPFFFVTLPNWFEENRSVGALAHNLHFWLSYSLLALVALHMIEQRQFLRRTWKQIFKENT
ncbi:MAG: cytochrome b/b6 domain-containing protein [Brasilonema octagenarum HA4186-MV1]|jgi:cytochrome b561|nr:cytochrome b/b6 domain-containing protein [Brasilonema octagenarum HA4186-MV1]